LKLSFALATVVLASSLAVSALAQEPYPSRPINLLVSTPPGGLIDVVARIAADGLRQQLKQQVVVFNRPGGNGRIAIGELNRAVPDGYTFFVSNDGGIAILAAVDPEFRFDYEKDYTPVAQIATANYVLIGRPSLPAKNITELVSYARANPGKLTYGSSGLASIPHLSAEMFSRNIGASMVHVPYQGAAPALNDLVKGQIDLLVNAVAGIAGMIGSDNFKILAAISDKRIALLPDVPTLKEAGVPPVELGAWLGMFAPPGIPQPVSKVVSDALQAALADPQVISRLETMGVEPSFKGPDAFQAVYLGDVRKWREFSQKYGFRIGN
jgi:tripartite-type tricarboxylate transporter receptor subunit TctC